MKISFNKISPIQFKASDKKLVNVPVLIDWDGTYEDPKDLSAKKILDEGLKEQKSIYKDKGINLICSIITARPEKRIMSKNPSKVIDYTTVQNGGSIYKGLPTRGNKPLEKWEQLNKEQGFGAVDATAIAFVTSKEKEFDNLDLYEMGEVVNNKQASENSNMRPFVIDAKSVILEHGETPEIFNDATYKVPSQVKKYLDKVNTNLEKSGMNFEITGPYLYIGTNNLKGKFKDQTYLVFDIASPLANKGKATNFMLEMLDAKPENTIIACDGGNDVCMMTDDKHPNGDGRNIIIVGKNNTLRKKAKKLTNNNIIIKSPDKISSIGVLEGIKEHLVTISARINNANNKVISFTGKFFNNSSKFEKVV